MTRDELTEIESLESSLDSIAYELLDRLDNDDIRSVYSSLNELINDKIMFVKAEVKHHEEEI